jgi:hypothetical protein
MTCQSTGYGSSTMWSTLSDQKTKAPQAVKLAGPPLDVDFERVITKVVAGAGLTQAPTLAVPV